METTEYFLDKTVDTVYIDQAIDAWIAEKATLSESKATQTTYHAIILRFRAHMRSIGRDLDPDLWADQTDRKAWRRANTLLVAEVQKFSALCWSGRKEQVADNTRRARIIAISSFYEFALRCDVFEGFANPVSKIKRPKSPASSKTRPLDVAQVAAAIRSIDRSTKMGARDYALFFVYFETSRRANEVLALCWGDVELLGTLENLAAHPEDLHLALNFRHCKGGKALYHVLSHAASCALLECGARCYEMNPLYMDKARPVWRSFSTAVCKEKRDIATPLTYNGVRLVCERHFGEGNGQLHRIRHTVARQCEKAGMPLREIQTMLGHSHINTTILYLDSMQAGENSVAATLQTVFGFQ